eukprot:Nk52_evm2s301 gene=Nk52_evmTU2s301
MEGEGEGGARGGGGRQDTNPFQEEDAQNVGYDDMPLLLNDGNDNSAQGKEEDYYTERGMEDQQQEEVFVYGDEDEDEEEDDGSPLVMDPDHPAMMRVQATLKDQLERQLYQTKVTTREKVEMLQKTKRERENEGVELYAIQQQLARLQKSLEDSHDQLAKVVQFRKQTDDMQYDLAKATEQKEQILDARSQAVEECQRELDKLNNSLFQLALYEKDKQGEIKVIKRIALKAGEDVGEKEALKMRQDIIIDNMTEQVKALDLQEKLYDAQAEAQKSETKKAKDMLVEANAEIDAITYEKTRLMHQWKSSLVGMTRRDEALSTILEAVGKAQEDMLSIETEMTGYKASIKKEQEKNESLAVILNKSEGEISYYKRMFRSLEEKEQKQRDRYQLYAKTMKDMEHKLLVASQDKHLHEVEHSQFQRNIENFVTEKFKLEQEAAQLHQDSLTHEKYGDNTRNNTKKLLDRIHAEEIKIASISNEIAQADVNVATLIANNMETAKKVKEKLGNLNSKDEMISFYQQKIRKGNDAIERKQATVDLFNRKLDDIVAKAGGQENGPLETIIHNMSKQIAAKTAENTEAQQFWLRSQNELVNLNKEMQSEFSSVEHMKRQYVLFNQKKIRLNSSFGVHEKEIADIRKKITAHQHSIQKLHKLVHEVGTAKDVTESNNTVLENEFISQLKDQEMESIQLEKMVQKLVEDKDQILKDIVDAERQVMLWEKKIQLAKEAKAALDPNVGSKEVQAMKNEIHRMKLRYTQLKKYQEKMIQEMVIAVERRESISTKGYVQARNKTVTRLSLQKNVMDASRKLENLIQNLRVCEENIRGLLNAQRHIRGQVEDSQSNVYSLGNRLKDMRDAYHDNCIIQMEGREELNDKEMRKELYSQALNDEIDINSFANGQEDLEKKLSSEIELAFYVRNLAESLKDTYPNLAHPLSTLTTRIDNKLTPS